MMGFGPFDHGSPLPSSLSSPSTLSPLAPPFTVPKSTPFSHVFDDPYDNWLHLHPPTSNSNPVPPPNPETIPFSTGFGCFGSQPIVSPVTHFPSSTTFNGFGPPQLPKSSLLEAEPFYPCYSFQDKGGLISGGFSFGASSNSGFTPSEGCYESGYGKHSSGFGQMAKGKGLWMESGREVQSNCSNPSQIGGPAVEGFAVSEDDSSVWPGKSVESLAKKAHIGSKCSGPELLDAAYTAFSQENASPFEVPASSVPVLSSVFQEVSYSQMSDTQPTKTWDPFKLKKDPYNKCFTELDSCTTGLTNFRPAPKFSFNLSGQPLETVALKNVLRRDQTADAYNNNDNFAGCLFSNVNSVGNEMNADTRGMSNNMDKNYHKFSGFPPMKTELPSVSTPVRPLRGPPKEKWGSKATQLSGFEALPSSSDMAGPDDSLGSSPEMLDQCLPAVDSPCWKGAPPQCSPLRGVVTPVHLPLMKVSEGCSDLNKQNQLLPDNVTNADSLSLKSPENFYCSESGCEKNGSAYFESGFEKKGPSSSYGKPAPFVTLPDAVDANKTGSDFLNFGMGLGLQSYIPMLESRRESSSELKASGVKPLSPEEDVTTPESRIVDPRADLNKEVHNFSFDFLSHAKEHASNVSSSGVSVSNESGDVNEVSDASSDRSSPRLDTQIVVKMIHNLSELLLSSHHSDGNALKENDYEVLQHVINNLYSCFLNKAGLMRPILAGSSFCLRKSTDPQEGTITGSSPLTDKEADHVLSIPSEGSIHALNKKADKFQRGCSSDNMAFEKDNEMSQDIEKVIKEKMQEQGEDDPQTLLYKKLWIEAEAALCSMKYELRLAQMKIKLEKCEQHLATDSHCSFGTAGEKSSNLDAIEDTQMDDLLAPKLNEFSTEKKVINTQAGVEREGSLYNPQEVKQPSAADEANDLESSVMVRFKILQNRVEKLSSTFDAVPKQQANIIDDMEHALVPRKDIIDNVQRHGLVPRQWCLERQLNVAMEDSPTKVVDTGFTEKRMLWPLIINQLEGGNSEVGNRECDVQSSDDGFCSDVLKEDYVDESVVPVADELASELSGNGLSQGGYDSPSSDWEHVLKEELTF
ncbi:hypothetical protein AAC387_Pa08g0667 [Persea americana]